MKRTRNCSNPEPACGGNPCFGVDEVEAECLVAECDRELRTYPVYMHTVYEQDMYASGTRVYETIYAIIQLQLVENLMQPSLLKDQAS